MSLARRAAPATTQTTEARSTVGGLSALLRPLGVLGILLLTALTVVLGAAPARAHASLISTDPVADAIYDEAPDAVTLTFNEPVGIELGGVTCV